MWVWCVLAYSATAATHDLNPREDYFELEVSLVDVMTTGEIPKSATSSDGALSTFKYYPIQCPYNIDGQICGGGGTCVMDYVSARTTCNCVAPASSSTASWDSLAVPFKGINTGPTQGLEGMCMPCKSGCPCNNFQFDGAEATATGCDADWSAFNQNCYKIITDQSYNYIAGTGVCAGLGARLQIDTADLAEITFAATLLPSNVASSTEKFAWIKTGGSAACYAVEPDTDVVTPSNCHAQSFVICKKASSPQHCKNDDQCWPKSQANDRSTAQSFPCSAATDNGNGGCSGAMPSLAESAPSSLDSFVTVPQTR
jgi:hypothetical protein